MSKTRMTAARRNAETILGQSRKRQENFKFEQERAHEAMVQKTARLRALRLAKEAADKQAAAEAPVTSKARKTRRSKQA